MVLFTYLKSNYTRFALRNQEKRKKIQEGKRLPKEEEK